MRKKGSDTENEVPSQCKCRLAPKSSAGSRAGDGLKQYATRRQEDAPGGDATTGSTCHFRPVQANAKISRTSRLTARSSAQAPTFFFAALDHPRLSTRLARRLTQTSDSATNRSGKQHVVRSIYRYTIHPGHAVEARSLDQRTCARNRSLQHQRNQEKKAHRDRGRTRRRRSVYL